MLNTTHRIMMLCLIGSTCAPAQSVFAQVGAVSVQSIDDLEKNLTYITELLDSPTMPLSLHAVQDRISGVDKSRPISVYFTWPSDQLDSLGWVLMVPLKDGVGEQWLEDLTGNPPAGQDDITEWPLSDGTNWFYRVANEFAYFSDTAAAISSPLPPSSVVSEMDSVEVLQARFFPRRLTEEQKRLLLGAARALILDVLTAEQHEADPIAFMLFPVIWEQIRSDLQLLMDDGIEIRSLLTIDRDSDTFAWNARLVDSSKDSISLDDRELFTNSLGHLTRRALLATTVTTGEDKESEKRAMGPREFLKSLPQLGILGQFLATALPEHDRLLLQRVAKAVTQSSPSAKIELVFVHRDAENWLFGIRDDLRDFDSVLRDMHRDAPAEERLQIELDVLPHETTTVHKVKLTVADEAFVAFGSDFFFVAGGPEAPTNLRQAINSVDTEPAAVYPSVTLTIRPILHALKTARTIALSRPDPPDELKVEDATDRLIEQEFDEKSINNTAIHFSFSEENAEVRIQWDADVIRFYASWDDFHPDAH